MPRIRGAWLYSSAGAQALNAIAGMATNILYAHQLPIDHVGLIALVSAIGTFSTVFLDRGIGAWMTRCLATGEIDFEKTVRIVLRAGLPGLIIAAVVFILSFTNIFGSDPNILFVAMFTSLFVTAFWIFQIGLSFTQGLDMPGMRSLGIISNGLLTFVGTAAAFAAGGGLVSALVATLVAYLVAGLALVIFSARVATPTELMVQWSYRRAVREARPLFGANIVSFAISSGDVVLASFFYPASQIGQYQIAKKVAQSAVLPLIAVLPVTYAKISGRSERERRLFVWTFVRGSALFFLVALVGGALTLPVLLPVLFGVKYAALAGLVLILLSAYHLQFYRDLLSVYSNARGIYGRSFTTSLATAISFVVLAPIFSGFGGISYFATSILLAFLVGVLAHIGYMGLRDGWDAKVLLQFALIEVLLFLVLITFEVLDGLLNILVRS